MPQLPSPLGGSAPSEVPLAQAPLQRVLFQVRFPRALALAGGTNAPPLVALQDAVKAKYPLFSEEIGQSFHVGPAGAFATQEDKIWRFADIKNEWRISLSPDFVTLETPAYKDRADFNKRARYVLDAIERTVSPVAYQRIGVRYVNRIVGADIDRLVQLVKPAALGIAATPLAPHIQHALSEAILEVEEGQILLRSFVLPPNVTYDPAVLAPINERAWILDMDLFAVENGQFDAKLLAAKIEHSATRLYSVFRWVVEEEFLRHFGGKP